MIRVRQLRLPGLVLLLAVFLYSGVADARQRSRNGRNTKAKVAARSKGKKAAHKRSNSPTAKTSLVGAKGAKWKSRRTFSASDTGLKDHAKRHSTATPKEYLARGHQNIQKGVAIKGGGSFRGTKYHFRKLAKGDYSMTITNKRGEIVSIDTWKSPGKPLTRDAIERGLKASGVQMPKRAWDKF